MLCRSYRAFQNRVKFFMLDIILSELVLFSPAADTNTPSKMTCLNLCTHQPPLGPTSERTYTRVHVCDGTQVKLGSSAVDRYEYLHPRRACVALPPQLYPRREIRRIRDTIVIPLFNHSIVSSVYKMKVRHTRSLLHLNGTQVLKYNHEFNMDQTRW